MRALRLALILTITLGAGTSAWSQSGFEAMLAGEPVDPALSWELSHLLDPARLGLFAIEALYTVALAALIAFHPVNAKTKERPGELLLPRLYMLYALIGVAIGFLVVQHGYLIGFVVFGIGGLLRFRSTFSTPEMTAEVILVTILGLSVGLNLPVIALMIAVIAWIVIWATGTLTGYTVNLHCGSEQALDAELGRLETLARDLGWTIVSVERSLSKPKAEILLQARRRDGPNGVRRKLADCFTLPDTAWRLDT